MSDLVIRWAPLPGTAQELFFDDDTPEADLLMAGGYGAGKTMTLTGKMLKLSAINAPIPIVWTVPQWAHVERTVLPTLEDIDPETGEPWFLRPGQYHYYPARHLLSWDGGGEIQFASAEHEDSIKGPNVAAAGVDEPGIVSARAWRNTVARVRHPNARLRQRVAAGTPEGPNWLMDHFGSDADRPEYVRVYTMPTVDNCTLPAEYIEQLKTNASQAELESYLHGRFSNLAGASAYGAFNADLHWRTDVDVRSNLPLCLSFDFNVDPMACTIGQSYPGPYGAEACIVDAVVMPASTIMDVCEEILRRYPAWKAGVRIYGDATGKARSTVSRRSNYDIIRDMLGAMGALSMHVPTSNPPVVQRLNSVNRMLKDAHGRTRLFIRKTLPVGQCLTRPLVRSLQQTLKKPGTTGIWKKAGETVSHAGDALGYWIDREWPATKPRVAVAMTYPNLSVSRSSVIDTMREKRRRRLAESLGVA